jgi:DNA-binding NarL/FixJ family response regulator
MIYQEGFFTRVVKAEDDLEHYLRRFRRYAPGTVLTKLVLPGVEQATVLNDLRLMTITPVVLMNDADGAGATAFNEAVRFRMVGAGLEAILSAGTVVPVV